MYFDDAMGGCVETDIRVYEADWRVPMGDHVSEILHLERCCLNGEFKSDYKCAQDGIK